MRHAPSNFLQTILANFSSNETRFANAIFSIVNKKSGLEKNKTDDNSNSTENKTSTELENKSYVQNDSNQHTKNELDHEKILENAKSLALKLYKKSPQYLFFFYFHKLQQEEKNTNINRKENIESTKRLLLKVMSSMTNIDTHAVYLLLKSGSFSYLELLPYEPSCIIQNSENTLDKNTGDNAASSNLSFMDLCLKKEFFLLKYNKIAKGTNEQIKDCIKELKQLLDILDDFSLYDFAIENNIEISEIRNETGEIDSISSHMLDEANVQEINLKDKNSVNFLWYKIIKRGDTGAARRIIFNSINFQDIKKILRLCEPGKINLQDNRIYEILEKFISISEKPNKEGQANEGANSCSAMKLLRENFNFLLGDPSFIARKLLLALLIATRDEKMLVLALFLSQENAFPANYEISLINMFLSRYFLMLPAIKKNFELLDIKNIQIHNLAFIWSDPLFSCSIKNDWNSIQGNKNIKCGSIKSDSYGKDQIALFKKEIFKIISGVESSFVQAINNGKIAVAYSALELRESLMNSEISKEIHNRRISSISKYTMFSGLLGESCSYLFDKLTVDDRRAIRGSVPTLKTVPSTAFSEDIFKNEFLTVTDSKLISEFKRISTLFTNK